MKTKAFIALILAMIFIVSGCVQQSSEEQVTARIKEKLIGMELKYSNIAGQIIIKELEA